MKTITITITEIPDEWPGATGKPGSHPSTESEDLIERITAKVREVLAASMRSDFRDGCQFPGMRYKVSAGGETRG